jgi:arylsulfatase A-like enzyme
VPLVMRVPGVAPRTVSTPVSLVDVMPTLLDLAGVEGPAGMNGRTLVPALHGGAAPVRPILLELAHDRQITRDMAGVVSAPWKVIWDRQANAWSLYKLDDSGDATNLRDDAALPELQRLLYETLDRETGVVPEAVPRQ